MASGLIAKRLLPALLMFTAANASAATILCSAVNGSSLATIAMAGSCSIGDLTFSDFVYQFTATADSPSTPNPSTDVTLDFNEITDNLTSDPFGTVGTATTPLYQVIVNFTAGNTVVENQSERYVLQYLVTDNNSGTQIVQVDNNIAGGAFVQFGASGGLTAKSLCDGAPFGSSSGTPIGTCNGTLYTSVAPNGGSQFVGNPDSQADSSINYNGPNQKFGGSIGSSNFGVYDQADISGGMTNALGSATVTQIENDFLESPVSSITTPEPAGFFACAFALGWLMLKPRRRKISA
jgi:hypothetical protein